ncbi:MAG TPA: thioredoxin domain-containing protein [Vicinamibacterales bacterium]
MPNRLARESSPYLLQHADNPVDWFPWGEEAFARARETDRPIFLSVGYSTCHWCHVMERESFENEEIARVLNEHFVPVKVDREERPDVDRVYMTFVQATTQQGGWPMSVWLTPDLRPFYGGTYFPPTARWGRPGFIDILRELSRLWREERPRILASADVIIERLREFTGADGSGLGGTVIAGPDTLRAATDQYRRAFDTRYGGFGQAPKFPRPTELLLLLREWVRTGEQDLRDMVSDTLGAMAAGGMRDHIGGGFHRYSVDERWRVPHFEKMLYDQAQLVIALLETAQATGSDYHSAVAEDTLRYVARDLTHPDGGFFSAEDADSIPPEQAGQPGAHPSEGAFYIWSQEEVHALLGEPDATVVRLRFGIEPNGNAPFDPQGEFGTKNLLYTASTIEEIAVRTGMSADDVVATLARARQKLFDARAKRPRPHLDDKVITSWNGLMIAAFARAGRVLAHVPDARAAEWTGRAEAAARFVRRELWDEGRRRLSRRWRNGEAGIEGYCEDYACLIWGLLELVQATGKAEWLEWARELQAVQDRLFWDEADGGWFNTTGEDPSVLLRLKEDYDGAEPSASSVSVRNLLDLQHLVPDEEGARRIERTLARFGPEMGQAARVIPFMLANLSAWHAGLSQIVIVGPPGREDTQALHRIVASRYLPFALVLPVSPGDMQSALAVSLPWLGSMTMVDGKATAYVCRQFACDRPVTRPDELDGLVAARAGRPAGS